MLDGLDFPASERRRTRTYRGGNLKKGEKRRVSWMVDHEGFRLEMECGVIPATPGDTSLFKTDPDIKIEELRHGGAKGRVMAGRKGPAIGLRNADGKMSALPLPVHATESLLSEVRDSAAYPAVSAARETNLAWRFFDHFPTHPGAPIRQPAVGFWSPELDSDGGNLAANLQTLVESRKSEPLDEIFQKAFPDCSWSAADEMGFQLKLPRLADPDRHPLNRACGADFRKMRSEAHRPDQPRREDDGSQ